MNEIKRKHIRRVIKSALEEDIKSGDITTLATIDKKKSAFGNFLVKQDGIIAGLNVVREVFNFVDTELDFETSKEDGEEVYIGEIVAEIEGRASSILVAERTALNFLQRMSGIATLSKTYSDKVKHTAAKIIDTRKTVPGLRILDKYAVRMGGCENHRIGLFDMFLIKDNHIEVSGSITDAVKRCKKFQKKNNLKLKIEVETTNLAQVEEALNCQVDLIMLDNFELAEMEKAVRLVNGRCKLEASGGVSLETVAAIAETGVDYISVGALTHSVKALDISLDISVEG